VMRCKVGDLAYVKFVGVTTPGLAGRYVVVQELLPAGDHVIEGFYFQAQANSSWICRAVGDESLPWASIYSDRVDYVHQRAIDDCILVPIRDPGEDARDESLSWLPVPSTVKEVA